MTLFISHSSVYGTEDWFDGEPDVYSIDEVEADCVPNANLWRNYYPNGNITVPIFSDAEPTNGFTAVDNIASSLIRAKVLSTAPPQAVVSSDNYVYWIDPTTTDGIGEYEIATDTVTHVFTIASGAIRQIGLVEERKVAVVVYVSFNYEVRLYDFATETYEVLFTRLGQVIDGATNNYTLTALITVESGDDILTMAISEKVSTPGSAPYHSTPYGVVDLYNHTTGVRDTYEVLGATRVDIDRLNTIFMPDAPVVVNGKLVFSYDHNGMEITGTSTDICECPYYIFDIATRDLSVAIDVAPGFGGQKMFRMASHKDLNRIYILAEFHSNDFMMDFGYLDLDTNTFTWSGGTAISTTGGFIQASNKCYFYRATSSSFNLYEVANISSAILSFNPGFFMDEINKLCTNIDEVNNRVWFYRSATSLRGYDIAAGTYIDLNTGVPAAAASPNRSYLVFHGAKMLITQYRTASNTVSLYIVRNT